MELATAISTLLFDDNLSVTSYIYDMGLLVDFS